MPRPDRDAPGPTAGVSSDEDRVSRQRSWLGSCGNTRGAKKKAQRENDERYPPPCGEGRRAERVGVGGGRWIAWSDVCSLQSSTIVHLPLDPHPYPSPQGGGENAPRGHDCHS